MRYDGEGVFLPRLMAILVGIAASIVALAAGEAADADPAKPAKTPHELVIRPNPAAAWGGEIADVRKVLESAAAPMWCCFPERTLPPILVEPKGGPIALFERGPDGELQVRLDTGDRLWAQHAYQFAHEFCHILCNYQDRDHPNRWFEESLCEMASIYSLKRMAVTWKTSPPYPNWKDYAAALDDYANKRLEPAKLPPGVSLPEWYRQHARELANNATLREENTIVAAQLLPLFEKEPEHWEAVASLNDGERSSTESLAEFLKDWQAHAPAKHRGFIAHLAEQFGITLEADAMAK